MEMAQATYASLTIEREAKNCETRVSRWASQKLGSTNCWRNSSERMRCIMCTSSSMGGESARRVRLEHSECHFSLSLSSAGGVGRDSWVEFKDAAGLEAVRR